MRGLLAVSVASALVPALFSAQDTPPSFPSEAHVVRLDVVASDSKGRALDDLRSDELSVFEGGRPCEIQSFRLVRSAPPPAAGAEASAPAPMTGPTRPASATPARSSLVVLVFDRMSTVTAPLARKGALDLISRSFPPDTWFAVFKFGYGVKLLQTFTAEPQRLRSAIEWATRGDADKQNLPSFPGLPQEAPPGPGVGRTALPDLATATSGLADAERELTTTVEGLDTLKGMLGIARALATVDGRKSLVYFCEAWHLPDRILGVYDELVSVANRANVTVHTVDVRGLTGHKPLSSTPLDSVVDSFKPETTGGGRGGAYTPTGWASGAGGPGAQAGRDLDTFAGRTVEILDHGEWLLRGPTPERLADDTGGLTIAGTNDLGAGLSRVAEELRQYYEMIYVPANPALDGSFRHIQVKTSRPGVRIRSRAGRDQPYVSTPLVTDRTLPPRRPGEPPRLVPLAHRRFAKRGPIFCEYEVFAFGGRRLAGVPQLWAGYTLERADGEVVSAEAPSAILTDGDRAVRRIVLPVEKLDVGAYSLVVSIQDRLAGRTIRGARLLPNRPG